MASQGLRKGNHCAYDLHYHFVFVVRYRRALLRPEVEAELVRLSHEIGERYEIDIEGVGADLNHVHLLCSAHPKIAPGDIARIYKSITAAQLFKSFPDLRREMWGGKFWSSGTFVSNAGPADGWATLIRYIENQGKNPEAENLRLLFTTTDATTQEQ